VQRAQPCHMKSLTCAQFEDGESLLAQCAAGLPDRLRERRYGNLPRICPRVPSVDRAPDFHTIMRSDTSITSALVARSAAPRFGQTGADQAFEHTPNW